MVTGITVPGSSLAAFRHREYSEIRVKELAPRDRVYQLPAAMAKRLLQFARICFVQGVEGYGPHSFMYYMIGVASSPTTQDDPPLKGTVTKTVNVRAGKPYIIIDNSRTSIHPFIGLAPGVALDVSGPNGMLNVCMTDQLIAAFGGTGVAELVIPR
ncbi:MAG TPA: hypothetical protein VFZ48_00075 [Candidatus Saccharimonadales bacterium]